MPSGRYISCPIDLHPDAGGQTRALLMRNRIFVTECGLSPTILTFNGVNDLESRREIMLERGLLLEQIDTRNIYAHYREHGWGTDSAPGPPLSDLSAHLEAEQTFPDGSPWRRTYRTTGRAGHVYDYLRADGTPYLRIPKFVFGKPPTWPRKIRQVDRNGRVVGEFDSVGQWFRRWIRELTDNQRSFVFVDSRYNGQHVIPMHAPHIHLLYVLHNIHVAPPRLWSSRHTEMYRRLMRKVGGTDALVTLTERQRADIAERRGHTTNLFVIPNPVDLPARPAEPRARDPFQVTVVARLQPQKRLTHAIAVFAGVLKAVPEARLDIFGEGADRPLLEGEIRQHGIGHAVTLRGHDPRAREALWTSSAFMMTSGYEGYPLSTLESLSHGCPVVSYDIKYGPREQITDGVDGFIVPESDMDAMTDRLVRMLTSPELVARMSAAALEKAAHHSPHRYAEDWRGVLESVVALKPYRTRLEEVSFELSRLVVVPGRRWISRRRKLVPPTPVRLDLAGHLEFAGRLRVRGHSPRAGLDSVVVTLNAVQHDTGMSLSLPVDVARTDAGFSVRGRVAFADICAGTHDVGNVRLRLRLVWQNSSWETFLGQREGETEGVELAFDSTGAVTLSWAPAAPSRRR